MSPSSLSAEASLSLVLTSASGGSLLLEQYPDARQDHRFRQETSQGTK